MLLQTYSNASRPYPCQAQLTCQGKAWQQQLLLCAAAACWQPPTRQVLAHLHQARVLVAQGQAVLGRQHLQSGAACSDVPALWHWQVPVQICPQQQEMGATKGRHPLLPLPHCRPSRTKQKPTHLFGLPLLPQVKDRCLLPSPELRTCTLQRGTARLSRLALRKAPMPPL